MLGNVVSQVDQTGRAMETVVRGADRGGGGNDQEEERTVCATQLLILFCDENKFRIIMRFSLIYVAKILKMEDGLLSKSRSCLSQNNF